MRENQIDIIPVMTGSKPWYKSKTIIGLIALVANMLSKKFSWMPEGEWEPFITTVIDSVGAILVAYGRVTAKEKVVIKKPQVIPLLCIGGAIAVMLAGTSCSTVQGYVEQAEAAGHLDTDQPVKFEVRKTTVAGFVLFDAIGIGFFLPSRQLQSPVQREEVVLQVIDTSSSK